MDWLDGQKMHGLGVESRVGRIQGGGIDYYVMRSGIS